MSLCVCVWIDMAIPMDNYELPLQPQAAEMGGGEGAFSVTGGGYIE